MKEILEVARPGRGASKVVVGDVATALPAFLPRERRVVVITDANVHRRYKELVDRYEYILVGMGETNKTISTVEKVYRELIVMGADRSAFILGIGGGIVTDIAGYVASTYMRGVDFGFMATTLLAQVDASIGGKNGVNVDGYKNMAGTFNQPDFVLCDIPMLQTLPEREMRTGMAEIIKAAVIADPALFALLESADPAELMSDPLLLRRMITAAIKVKAAVVEADEREAGERKKLNLGHTIAHAIEKSGRDYTHGEAVAIGLATISDAAVRMGMLSGTDRNRIKTVIERMGLPLSTSADPKQLIGAMASDKKKNGGKIDLIVPVRIGECRIVPVPLDELGKYIAPDVL